MARRTVNITTSSRPAQVVMTWRCRIWPIPLARRHTHRPVRTTVIASSQLVLIRALRGVTDDTPYQGPGRAR
jgi:hypothetical protein